MAKTTRIKTAALPVPRDQKEAEALLLRIGTLQRQVSRIEAGMNDMLADIKARHEEQAAPANAEIEVAFQALHAWAEANRETLCPGRLKTAKLATGEIAWRVTPPSVRIMKPEVVIERLKHLGLTDLLRTREDINKDAILADPARVESVKGIAITQREEFVAKPYESQIERVEPVKTTTKEAA